MSWPGLFLGLGRGKGGPRHFKACNENLGPWCGGFTHPAGREMEGGSKRDSSFGKKKNQSLVNNFALASGVPSDSVIHITILFKKIFIYFYLFSHTRSYLQQVGSSCLTRDGTQAPCIGSMES